MCTTMLIFIALWSCQETPERSIHNSDITWVFSPGGLLPRLKGEAKRIESTPALASNADLCKLLVDPERYVAAHVLLVSRTRQTVKVSSDQWFGMRVIAHKDGSFTYDQADMKKLRTRWTKELKI